MADALIGMGSNIEPEQNLSQAASALRDLFGSVRFSSVYRSEAVGMAGDDFLNACCLLQTTLMPSELRSRLKALEDAQGRDRSLGSWKPRTIDLDLLIYDSEIIDDEIFRYAHAYVPASELMTLAGRCDSQQQLCAVALHL